MVDEQDSEFGVDVDEVDSMLADDNTFTDDNLPQIRGMSQDGTL